MTLGFGPFTCTREASSNNRFNSKSIALQSKHPHILLVLESIERLKHSVWYRSVAFTTNSRLLELSWTKSVQSETQSFQHRSYYYALTFCCVNSDICSKPFIYSWRFTHNTYFCIAVWFSDYIAVLVIPDFDVCNNMKEMKQRIGL